MKANKFDKLSEGLSDGLFDAKRNDFGLQAITGSATLALFSLFVIVSKIFHWIK